VLIGGAVNGGGQAGPADGGAADGMANWLGTTDGWTTGIGGTIATGAGSGTTMG
jgi:hypothetical protein